MPNAKVADNRRIFTNFTEMHDKAKKDGDEVSVSMLLKTLDLWERTVMLQHKHDEQVTQNVRDLQRQCGTGMLELASLLASMSQMLGGPDDNENGGITEVSPALALISPPMVSFPSFSKDHDNGDAEEEDDDDDEEDEGESEKFELYETPRGSRFGDDSRDESRDDMPTTEFSSRKSKLTPSLQFSQRSAKKGSGGRLTEKGLSARLPLFDDTDELLVEACKRVCCKLEESLRSDVLSVPSNTITAGFATKSTVGMMLVGNTVDNMVIGGPAYNSQKLNKGDVLLKVDDVEVDGERLHDMLIGQDIPGTFLNLTVRDAGSGHLKEVTLKRMATSAIADRVRIFEVFASLKEQKFHDSDRFATSLVDEAIELWTGMLLSEAERGNTVQVNVLDMQYRCQQLLTELKVLLNEVHVHGSAPNPTVALRIGADLFKTRLSQVGEQFARKPGPTRPSNPHKATIDDNMFIEMIEDEDEGSYADETPTSPGSQARSKPSNGSAAVARQSFFFGARRVTARQDK